MPSEEVQRREMVQAPASCTSGDCLVTSDAGGDTEGRRWWKRCVSMRRDLARNMWNEPHIDLNLEDIVLIEEGLGRRGALQCLARPIYVA